MKRKRNLSLLVTRFPLFFFLPRVSRRFVSRDEVVVFFFIRIRKYAPNRGKKLSWGKLGVDESLLPSNSYLVARLISTGVYYLSILICLFPGGELEFFCFALFVHEKNTLSPWGFFLQSDGSRCTRNAINQQWVLFFSFPPLFFFAHLKKKSPPPWDIQGIYLNFFFFFNFIEKKRDVRGERWELVGFEKLRTIGIVFWGWLGEIRAKRVKVRVWRCYFFFR